LTAAAALVLGAVLASATPGIPRAVPREYRAQLARTLRLAGRNSGQLEQVLLQVDTRAWGEACFLLANLPYRDLGTVDAELILENIRWAIIARDSLPWGEAIPAPLFRHYVLPHRATQEKLTKWRRDLFEELHPLVRDCESMSAAALKVNEWVGSKVRFEPTEARDQSPLATLARGIGRCEELTILYVCAARAVCIPARSCWTPWWAVSDNNHAWVEVWADGSWHYLGAAEPADSLDTAWFRGPARRAAAVYSACFGRCEGCSEPIYRSRDRYAIVNSIATYSRPCSLMVTVTDGTATPVPRAQVQASVFNYGQLLPAARAQTGSDGLSLLILGPGDYILTGGDGSHGAWSTVSAHPDSLSNVVLRLTDSVAPPEGFLWLRYPEPAQ
jgi:hypothetical protein